VGMATNIPPHNLNEVVSGVIAYIKNNQITFEELTNYIKAPDFPTGGILCGNSGAKMAYRSGKGKVVIKAKTSFEDRKIIVHEIPYMVNKSNLLENIASLVKNGTIPDISDLRDESDRTGMRIVIELKKNSDENLVLNLLFKHTALKNTFGMNLLALNKGKPQVMNLKDMIKHFVSHRKEVVIRRTQFDLKKSEDRAHILEGLKIALENIDPIELHINKTSIVDPNKPRILRLDFVDSPELQQLYDAIEQALFDAGLAHKEVRKFNPHITLARIKTTAPIEEFKSFSDWKIKKIFTVVNFELQESVLSKKGPEYTVLQTFDI